MIALAALLLLFFAGDAHAAIQGITGPTFNLEVKEGHLSVPDGGSIYSWGYSDGGAAMQYPGPTLIVDEGDTVTVRLTNHLQPTQDNVSIVFPGHAVTASGGLQGIMTREAPPDGTTTVTYSFTASEPGTYTYYSGTRSQIQIEMGLVGVLIVRPDLGAQYAYNDPISQFDREYLFLFSEMDPKIHQLVEQGRMDEVDTSTRYPVYWFMNGRAAMDTLLPDAVPWLPHQPYGALVLMKPGERMLKRVVGAGRDMHPHHPHGNHVRVIARDGRLLESDGTDLSTMIFTINSVPGQTVDAIFEWTGENLGWDIYGPINAACTDNNDDGLDDSSGEFCHDATCEDSSPADGFDDATSEYCADHGSPLPVELPALSDLAFGGFWSGSPFLGAEGSVPPGEGGLNPWAAFGYMWHSHAEKELCNYDIFPGGMLTMLFVVPPWAQID
jgi:plastocyanin